MKYFPNIIVFLLNLTMFFNAIVCKCQSDLPTVKSDEISKADTSSDFFKLPAEERKKLIRQALEKEYQGLFPAQINNDKWGYWGEKGFVIEPKFDQVTPFKGDRALVKYNNKWVYIDKKGNILEPFKLNDDCKIDYTKENPYELITKNGEAIKVIAIEVFKISDDKEKDLSIYCFQGRKVSITNLLNSIKDIVKLSPESLFVIVCDSDAIPEKIEKIKLNCQDLGIINLKIINTNNLKEKLNKRNPNKFLGKTDDDIRKENGLSPDTKIIRKNDIEK